MKRPRMLCARTAVCRRRGRTHGGHRAGGIRGVVRRARVDDAPIQYLLDSGTVSTFKVRNTGTRDGIGAVEIARPSKSFTVVGCPQAPSGWSTQVASDKCRYRSGSGSADDIAPGASGLSFKLKSATGSGKADVSGTWKVTLSASNQLDDKHDLSRATSEPPGLTVKAHVFEILDAVVATTAATPGSACPPANKQAPAGATRVIVICGKNHSKAALTPTARRSSLGGTLIVAPGTFSSGRIAANSSSSRVLGNWSGARISSTSGSGKTVVAKIGSSPKQTSPLTTLTGYGFTNRSPDAVADEAIVKEDTAPNPVIGNLLSNDSDPDGDPLSVTNVGTFALAHGTLTVNPDGTYSYTLDNTNPAVNALNDGADADRLVHLHGVRRPRRSAARRYRSRSRAAPTTTRLTPSPIRRPSRKTRRPTPSPATCSATTATPTATR